MKKKTRITLLTVGALTVAGAVLVGFMGSGGGGNRGNAGTQSAVRTTVLTRVDLQSTVSATGTIYSTDSTNVYSSLSYPVKTVHVSVGDTVQEGDILAELDTTSLKSDISQKQASISSSQATAQQNLLTAQNDLATYRQNIENNLDSSLLNAEAAVASAELEVEAASAELSSASRKHREAKNDNDDIGYTDSEIRALLDTKLQKEIALEKSQANLEKAKKALEAAKNSSGNDMQVYENKVKSAELNTNFNDQWIAIQKLQADIADCTVKAPVSGTITAVKAVEGASGSGLLFVIQDTESLKVVTNVKEYDIDSVQIGDKVSIKTDATGDTEFTGTLSKIAPTSTLSADGGSADSTDAEFESEVTVTDTQMGLRIGMNARLNIITEERFNVFSVPYEAVETDSEGNSFIYVAKQQADGTYYAASVPVETGIETNLYVEVSSGELEEGMHVVKNAQSVKEGDALDIPGAAGAQDMPLATSGDNAGTESPGGGNRPAGAVMVRPA